MTLDPCVHIHSLGSITVILTQITSEWPGLWNQLLGSYPTSATDCVTSGKFLNLSVPQFSPL